MSTAHSTLVSLQFLQAAGTGYPHWPTPWPPGPSPSPLPALSQQLAPLPSFSCCAGLGLGLGLGLCGAVLRFAFTLLAPSVRGCVEVLLISLLRPHAREALSLG